MSEVWNPDIKEVVAKKLAQMKKRHRIWIVRTSSHDR